MSGVEDGQNPSHIADQVQNLIEKCLIRYMSQKEVTQTLSDRKRLHDIIEIIWQRLEHENEEFFRAYHLLLMVKDQITGFNKLLQKQAMLMDQVQSGNSFASMPNQFHLPSTHQSTVYYNPENFRSALETRHMQKHVTRINFPGPFTYYESPSIPQGMQSAVDMPAHLGRINAAPNILVPQKSNVGMNGAMMNAGAGYDSRLMYGPGNSVLKTCDTSEGMLKSYPMNED